ncbi:hypothetical protein Plhal703r1_c64g0167781 [Plasmopara halstedii]
MSFAMSSSPHKRPISARLKRCNSLRILLGILVILMLVVLFMEISFVSSDIELEKYREISRAIALAAETSINSSFTIADKFYPDEILSIDWSKHIKKSDIVHQAALYQACLRHKTSVILPSYGRSEKNETWNLMQLVNQTDPERFQKLQQCPDIDIFVPEGLRNFGYCEDAAAYAKFLEARMLPYWALDPNKSSSESTYHDSCQNTPVIFFNHYSEGLLDLPNWPANKPVYLMPNIEMFELESEHYWRADVILCKTALCYRYLNKWYEQAGNPRGTRVLYTRHTTSNLAMVYKSQLNSSATGISLNKDFANVKFLHTVGSSTSKGTMQVLGCWLNRPELPRLDLYISQSIYDDYKKRKFVRLIRKRRNIHLHTGVMEPAAFGQLIANSAYFMCPSQHEGYGHYINQARSSRALIITTDVAPMNELITPTSGILIPVKKVALDDQFLGGISMKKHALRGVQGFYADFHAATLCSAVSRLLNTTIEERMKRADKALQQYYFDTVFFAHSMQSLRAIARYYKLHNHLRYDDLNGI